MVASIARLDWWFASSLAVASAIGGVAWRGSFGALALVAAVPALVFAQRSRAKASAVAFAYYASASLPVIASAESFQIELPVSIWLAASVLLVLPWSLFWTRAGDQRWWRCIAAVVVSVIPPVGIIGWASPLVAAGTLFPGTAWIGLLATAGIPSILLLRPVPLSLMGVIALFAVGMNATYQAPAAPNDIVGINMRTDLAADPNGEFDSHEALQSAILSSAGNVTVLPEAVVDRWTVATDAFWEPTTRQLRETGRTALIGGGIPIPGSGKHQNALIIIGATTRVPFLQRIPVPLGMWRPFDEERGVPLNLFGPGAMPVHGHRAAVLICYEQLLVWPMLQSALKRPTLLIAIANERWTRHTSIPHAQQLCVRAWSRLFALPVVSSTNS